jgi:hypothetical protein
MEVVILHGEQDEKRTEKTVCNKGSHIDYLGRLGGPKRASRDGPSGVKVKTVWIGLMKLCLLLAYREYLK